MQVIADRPEGVEIETPRYRAFTDLARQLAGQGANFVEIAGNDDILYTAITQTPDDLGALHRFARQGNAGYRHLMLVKVTDLADALRQTRCVPCKSNISMTIDAACILLALPVVIVGWIAILALVMRLSVTRPAALVILPPADDAGAPACMVLQSLSIGPYSR